MLALVIASTIMVLCALLAMSQTTNATTAAQPDANIYLPVVANNFPWPVYQWLSQQQVGITGLLPSQQDHADSTTYVNALAVMAFTLEGDPAKAKKTLDFFNSKAGEFFGDTQCSSFDAICATTSTCGATHPCGFFQSRNADSGVPSPNANRWTGDNAWLLMAIHYYRAATGDASYDAMARSLVRLLRSLEQPDGQIPVRLGAWRSYV